MPRVFIRDTDEEEAMPRAWAAPSSSAPFHPAASRARMTLPRAEQIRKSAPRQPGRRMLRGDLAEAIGACRRSGRYAHIAAPGKIAREASVFRFACNIG